jgi:WD40 repeat protein
MTAAKRSVSGSSISGRHLVITVHGIRTFGNWQERLESLLKARDPSIQVVNYKYGYFSIFAFIVPFLRWLVTRRFRRDLLAQSQRADWDRIDLVGHSFGTHLIGWGLHGMDPRQRPRMHTVILSGSVLKPGFPWGELVGDSVQRVVNDCGTRDIVLLVNQLAVLFSGMAGREGFSGMTGESFRNRFFELGHSGYFTRSGRSDDIFMRDYWLPLLLTEAPIVTVPDPRAPTAWRGVQTYLFNNAEPIKLAIWITPFVLLTLWVLEQRQSAVQQRDVAVARLFANVAAENLEQRPQRALLLALEAVIATEDKALPVAREVLHEALRLSSGLPLVGQNSDINLVAVNPQGTRLATAGRATGLVFLWDLVNTASKPLVIDIEDAAVRALVFDSTGQWLAAGGNNGVHLFDTAQFKRRPLPMGADLGKISTVAFDPQGRWFAAIGDRVQVWSLADTEAVPRILDSDGVVALAFEPGGSRLVTHGYSQNILEEGEKRIGVTSEFLRLWDLNSRLDDSVELPTISDDGFAGGIAFDPLGRWLAAGSGGSLLLWNLQAPKTLPIVIARHNAHISTIAFDPGGRWLASGDEQGAVTLSSLETGGREPQTLGKHQRWVTSLAFDSKGQRLASASADATVRLWNLAEPETEAIVLRGHDEFVSALTFDPRDRWLVSGSSDGTARIWQLDRPEGNPIVEYGHRS